jgi:hypothetical protein
MDTDTTTAAPTTLRAEMAAKAGHVHAQTR